MKVSAVEHVWHMTAIGGDAKTCFQPYLQICLNIGNKTENFLGLKWDKKAGIVHGRDMEEHDRKMFWLLDVSMEGSLTLNRTIVSKDFQKSPSSGTS